MFVYLIFTTICFIAFAYKGTRYVLILAHKFYQLTQLNGLSIQCRFGDFEKPHALQPGASNLYKQKHRTLVAHQRYREKERRIRQALLKRQRVLLCVQNKKRRWAKFFISQNLILQNALSAFLLRRSARSSRECKKRPTLYSLFHFT
jgi:hypothetical protein